MSEWMNEPEKQQELNDEMLDEVVGGMDVLPADQAKDMLNIIDNVIMPQIVTDADPDALRSK